MSGARAVRGAAGDAELHAGLLSEIKTIKVNKKKQERNSWLWKNEKIEFRQPKTAPAGFNHDARKIVTL